MAEINDVVMVKWIDTTGFGRWEARKYAEDLRPSEIESYGRLIKETDEFVTVAGSVDLSIPNTSNTDCIPKSSITSVTVLRKGKGSKK